MIFIMSPAVVGGKARRDLIEKNEAETGEIALESSNRTRAERSENRGERRRFSFFRSIGATDHWNRAKDLIRISDVRWSGPLGLVDRPPDRRRPSGIDSPIPLTRTESHDDSVDLSSGVEHDNRSRASKRARTARPGDKLA